MYALIRRELLQLCVPASSRLPCVSDSMRKAGC